MDKEGQNTNAPSFEANVFNSDSIGNRATSEYFSDVKGGKKDKEKVAESRTRKSRKRLFIILGVVSALLLVAMFTALIINFNTNPHGSRTDEAMPSNMSEIEERAYKVLYSSGKYEDTIVYLNDLIKDMKDLNVDSELIFEAYVVRARVAYQAGGEEVAIDEALRLAAKEADTDAKKYKIYNVLYYMYSQEGDTEKSDFYSDMMNELNVPENKIEGEVPIADEEDSDEENSDDESEGSDKDIETSEDAEEDNNE